MEIASVVFEHGFDQGMLEQIQTLRTLRLDMAEKMLLDLEKTSLELKTRGLIEPDDEDQLTPDYLRGEILNRISTLRERIGRPEVVYADEISLFVDLLESDSMLDDEIDLQ